jgi:hypothetical protein
MADRVSKRLVIDADVARACGGKDAVHPVSKRCRDFLSAVLKVCHRLVMTHDIYVEWERHMSRFARTWRYSMFAKKKVVRLTNPGSQGLRGKMGTLQVDGARRETLLKDVHLLEAALSTDMIVVSGDNAVRSLFKDAAKSVAEIRRIVWVNPAEESNPCAWLEDGAPAQPGRTLSYLEEVDQARSPSDED